VAAEAEPISDLAEAYERTALRWEELQAQPAEANKVFDENHSIYKRLREHEEVRLCIGRLMAHESPAVRLFAATHSLAWQPESATETLEAIEREGGLPAVTAKWTLRSHRAGKLDLDW
jgi:hypothetical protein